MADIFHFRNAGAIGIGIAFLGVYLAPMNVVLGIEYHSRKFFLIQAHEDLVVASLVREDAGGNDVGLIKLIAMAIILHRRNYLGQRSTGNESQAHPVVDDPIRNVGVLTRHLRL